MSALRPGSVTLAELRAVWDGAPVALADEAWTAIDASAAAVDAIVASGRTVYGINTGFGLLASTRIPPERLAELQRNLILSHSAGLGEPLPPRIVRLMMALKAIGLGRGYQRRPAVDRRAAAGADRGGRAAGRAEPGLGRRLGRSRAARPYERGA